MTMKIINKRIHPVQITRAVTEVGFLDVKGG